MSARIDLLIETAERIVNEDQSCRLHVLQRKLGLSGFDALRLVRMLQERGTVGDFDKSTVGYPVLRRPEPPSEEEK